MGLDRIELLHPLNGGFYVEIQVKEVVFDDAESTYAYDGPVAFMWSSYSLPV